MRGPAMLVPLLYLLYISQAEGGLLSNALGSNMVLQRAPQQANLWGWSAPGAEIKVRFNGTTFATTAQSDSGKWSLFLPPTPASGPHQIDISSSTNERVVLENVYFGDVFVCSGQSNMEVSVNVVSSIKSCGGWS